MGLTVLLLFIWLYNPVVGFRRLLYERFLVLVVRELVSD